MLKNERFERKLASNVVFFVALPVCYQLAAMPILSTSAKSQPPLLNHVVSCSDWKSCT